MSRKEPNPPTQRKEAMNVNNHLEMLGKTGTDKVTKFTGVITSICFDLFGCIQCVLVPPAKKGEKKEQGQWFDVRRVTVKTTKRVMELPDYEKGYIAEGRKGAAHKPAGRTH